MTTPHTPVVILIHGAGLNGASWAPVRRHIDPAITLITPDLPGHGARMGEKFTLAGAVETVARAAREAGNGPFVLGGDSLGGYASMAAAAAFPPQQLKGLLLSGCSANLSGISVMMPFFVKRLLTQAVCWLMNKQQLDRMLHKSLHKFGLAERDITIIMEAGMNPGVFPQAVEAIRDIDFRARVAAMTQPVLFVNGGNDKIFVRQEDAFVAAARSATRFRFDQTDHGVSLLRAREFADLVNAFALPLLTQDRAA